MNQSCSCWPVPQPQHHRVLHPLNKARGWTWVFMNTSWVCYHRAMTGPPNVETLFLAFLFVCLGPHPRHMVVPRLGLNRSYSCWPTPQPQQLRICVATATRDPSPVCDLHHNSQQCWILNPLSKDRDRTWTPRFLVRFVSAVPRCDWPHIYISFSPWIELWKSSKAL